MLGRMTSAAPMHEALAAIAEAGIDPVPIVFERFFAAYPAERARFYNLDAAAGRMTMETIDAIIALADGAGWVTTSVTNFVDLHRNYGPIDLSVYFGFVDITAETIIALSANHHSAALWRHHARALNQLIAAVASDASGV